MLKKTTIAVRLRSFRPLAGNKASELQEYEEGAKWVQFPSPHGD